MHLLERQEQLDTLNRAFQDARNLSGRLVLVSGEAGIGKSSLVERFVTEHRREARIVWGACDALATPRALAPVHEIAAQMSAKSSRAQHDEEPREGLFRSIVADLAESQRAWILVLEDVHWADDATLDFLRYLGKRVQRAGAVLLATYRDDELTPSHPVRLALGELTGHHVTRLRLAPLSLAAVEVLANDSGRDAATIHQATGGNPFFLREVLASAGGLVPETVRDAVLARLMRCSPAARDLAELVCISPGKTEGWLIESVLGVQHAAIDEAGARGLVQVQSDVIEFRHEIARRAVYSAIPVGRVRLLHKRILDALVARGADLTRLIHHAVLAEDVERILEYAPLGAVEAARLGAHRAAAAHLGAALKHAKSLPLLVRAELYEQHAREASLANQTADSIRSAVQAVALWREAGNSPAQARILSLLSQEYRTIGDKERADDCIATAIALLEAGPPGADLAMAYSARALLAVNRGWDQEALDLGQRALEIAREVGDRAIEAHALCSVGSALLGRNDLSGYAPLDESLQIALAHNLEDHAARAYRSLLFYAVLVHDFARAESLFTEGLCFCEERGIFSHGAYIQAYFAPCELDRGRWAEAADMAARLLQSVDISGVQQRITLLATLALVRVRRGDPGAEDLLEQAFQIALPTGEVNRIGRVAAARAEHAWYREDFNRSRHEADLGLAQLQGYTAPWIKGELLYWRSRSGTAQDVPTDIAVPYRLMLEGRWQEAAGAWQRIGMPYEQALALLEGSEEALREALGICEELGAGRLAAIIRRRLREQGAKGIPRGPNEATRTNPSGLTSKEIEVLLMLARGGTNAQIARQLHRSIKTIDHHVSAILEKLGVRSRAEAVAAAFALNIMTVPPDKPRPQEAEAG